ALVCAGGIATCPSPCGACVTQPPSMPPGRPAPAEPTLCRVGDRPIRQALPPQTGAGSAGTVVPKLPESRQPPLPRVPCAPIGSKHPETFASCGPVATSPGSSIRLHSEAENRTTRVLPNPDNS